MLKKRSSENNKFIPKNNGGGNNVIDILHTRATNKGKTDHQKEIKKDNAKSSFTMKNIIKNPPEQQFMPIMNLRIPKKFQLKESQGDRFNSARSSCSV